MAVEGESYIVEWPYMVDYHQQQEVFGKEQDENKWIGMMLKLQTKVNWMMVW